MKGPNVPYFFHVIIVAAVFIEKLFNLLQNAFNRLAKLNLTLDQRKVQMCKLEITYLGFSVNRDGFSRSESDVNNITTFPVPKNVKQVQAFLDMNG